MSKSKDQIIKELKELDQKLALLNEMDRLCKCKCKICGSRGCDVLSFKHQGPVHSKCLYKSS